MPAQVITYYLEMLHPHALRPSQQQPVGCELKRVEIPCPELNRFFYTAVGGDWYWLDRLPWTYEQWLAWLSRPEVETWMALVSGTPAGYFELEAQPGPHMEIAYFGLLPQFIGRGIGGWLLTAATQRAWQLEVVRVWLHTCSLDHPYALKHYQQRGFRIYKQEVSYLELPTATPGPWTGAQRPLSPVEGPRVA